MDKKRRKSKMTSEAPLPTAPVGDGKSFAEMVRELEDVAISLEFGDNTITIRDGTEDMVARIPLEPFWTRRVGEIMGARRCNRIGARLSEHARFTIREVKLQVGKAQDKMAARPGMSFEGSEHTKELF